MRPYGEPWFLPLQSLSDLYTIEKEITIFIWGKKRRLMNLITGRQKMFLGLTWILFVISFIASGLHADAFYLVISVVTECCCVALGAVSLDGVTRYRLPLVWTLTGVSVFALGDLFILLFHDSEDFFRILRTTENFHSVAGLIFGVAICIYVSIDFSRRELSRILMDVFLIAVLVGVTMRTTIRNVLSIHGAQTAHLSISIFFFFIAPIFIVSILIMIVSLRAPFSHPWSSYVLLVALLIFTGCEFQHAFDYATAVAQASEHIGVIYLLSFVLMATSFVNPELKQTHPITAGEFNQKLSLVLGWVFALTSIFVSAIFLLIHYIDEKSFIFILIASLAYVVMWKTQQAYELQQIVLESAEKENKSKEQQLVHAQAEKDALSRQLEQSSFIDTLTGLYNRNYLPVYLEQMMDDDFEKSITFFSVDINYFKSVNDTYGYGVGDLALMEIAKRLSVFSEYEKQVFRVGGDEFLLILRAVKDHERIFELAADLAEALDHPIEIHGNRLHLVANIGIAAYPWDSMNIYEILNFAEMARNSIKHSSRKASFTHYDVKIAPRMNRMHQIERRLQEVDFDENFIMYYQPQVRARDHKLIGMEALIRWNDEKLGFVSPAEFIPMAEEMGIMVALGEWINRETMTQIKKWNETYHTNLTVGINVSPLQMRDPEFATKFICLQDAIDIPTEWLDIELTEGIATNGTFYNNENLKTLRHAGFTFSIDDFGTGYASFANMIHFNYDRLKIAKELVDDLVTDENARVIVESVIFMAKGMHMHTIAEGVEKEEQLRILTELGCEQIQGYYFGKPLPAADFEKKWFDIL